MTAKFQQQYSHMKSDVRSFTHGVIAFPDEVGGMAKVLLLGSSRLRKLPEDGRKEFDHHVGAPTAHAQVGKNFRQRQVRFQRLQLAAQGEKVVRTAAGDEVRKTTRRFRVARTGPVEKRCNGKVDGMMRRDEHVTARMAKIPADGIEVHIERKT